MEDSLGQTNKVGCVAETTSSPRSCPPIETRKKRRHYAALSFVVVFIAECGSVSRLTAREAISKSRKTFFLFRTVLHWQSGTIL